MRWIKSKLVSLPRKFRVWWGMVFLYMLGKFGTHEVPNDINLYNELSLWVNSKGKPYEK